MLLYHHSTGIYYYPPPLSFQEAHAKSVSPSMYSSDLVVVVFIRRYTTYSGRIKAELNGYRRRQVTAARLPPHAQNSIANKPQLKRQEASQQLPDRSKISSQQQTGEGLCGRLNTR